MRTLVMGDPHGGLKAIKQVLERCYFQMGDTLIVLGDVADGWPEAAESLEYLIKMIPNLIYIRGNHDQWLKEWLEYGRQPDVWTLQGGLATKESYLKHPEFPEIGKRHLEFLKKTPCFYVDNESRCFIHGGLRLGVPVEETPKIELMWLRNLWDKRNQYVIVPGYLEVYVGHTSIYRFSHNPIWYENVCFMDTGAGWEGVLSIMDIDTKQVWQSDLVKDLYPESRGRN